MAVPLLDLNAQNLPLEPELKAAFERVLRSGHFILGPEVEAFEKKIAGMVGARHAIGVSSGTDGILLALMALGIGPGDEVICPSFTFFATAGCISRVGATPVFADSCPHCFNIDVEDAARKVTSRTKALMPVHLFGQAADMDRVMELAGRRGLPVIEDAAQSMGATHKGRQLGTIGTFGMFSLFPSKNLGGFGDGGIVVTNDDELAGRARMLRAHGAKPKYFHKYVGGNFRLDPLQAALLSVKLPHYDDYTAGRRRNAAAYTEKLSAVPGIVRATLADSRCADHAGAKPLLEDAQIVLPAPYAHNGHIWNQYTLRVLGEGRRDALKALLTERKIGTEVYYPVPMHRQECFAGLPTAGKPLPNAERLSREALSVPIYPELPREKQEEVVGAIAEFVGAAVPR
jgi:dTDP-4-amino-4,6-dideoxygalactose transaminase